MMRPVLHPITKAQLHGGRNLPPPVEERKCHLPAERFLTTPITLPDRTNWRGVAMGCLHQMLLNDRLSCCTASLAFHIEGVWLANSFEPGVLFSNQQVSTEYQRFGYKPGDPSTDQGCDEIQVLDDWHAHGLIHDVKGDRRPIAGRLSVNADNLQEVKTLIAIFGPLYGGASLPGDWLGKDLPRGDTSVLDVAGDPNPDDGHALGPVDFDGYDFPTSTWGMIPGMTGAALRKYFVPSAQGELHCLISTDALVRGHKLAPNGFDWPAMVAAFNAHGGNIAPLAHLIA